MPFLRYTGSRGKTTSCFPIFPTPTQMLLGIQFQREFGDTTVTVWPFGSRRLRCRAAVCPATPAPRTTTSAMAFVSFDEWVVALRLYP